MKEVWKDIPEYEGLYQVSSMGNIKSFSKKKNGKNLIPQKNKKGYYQILLYKNKKPYTKKIHRIVAKAFIPNPDNLPQVNHIDGNKINNCMNNLEWCTNSENQIHAYKNGLEKPRFQRRIKQYDINGNYIKTFEYIRNAQKELNIDGSSISKCCKGKRKSAGGYIWKYVNDNN